jgi:hypothetical protein
MKMYDVDGNFVNADIRESRYPLKGISKSALQGKAAIKLRESYPYASILEEFQVPGSQMTVDFFVPSQGLVVEVDGRQHEEFVPFFHGDKSTSRKFVEQVNRDGRKELWAQNNKFKMVRITEESQLEILL